MGWDDERRALLRAELDAAYFHLYAVEREDVDYVMETFPVVRKRVHSRGRLSWAVEPGLISGGVSACRLDLRALIVDHLGRVRARAALALL